MADWFKIDAHLFSDPKIRFCMDSHRDFLIVFIWCLSRCCTEKSDRFNFENTKAELEGLSSLLGIDSKEVFTVLHIMVSAKLISLTETQVVVKQWEKHQSEYLNRKSYFAKRYKDSTVKHSEAPLSSLRGEERRREESTEYTHSLSVLPVEKPPAPIVETAKTALVSAEKTDGNGKPDIQSQKALFDLQQRTSWLKDEICKVYRRPVGGSWTYDEETLLCDVARRRDSKDEWRELISFRQKLPPTDRRFFPQSIRSLLSSWDATLDKARVHVDTGQKTLKAKIFEEHVASAKKAIAAIDAL